MPQASEQLAAAVELNSCAWVRLQGRLPGVELHEDEDVVWVFSGDAWPQNTVALAKFSPTDAHRRIKEILQHHLLHKAACNWIVGPLTQPPDISRHLRANGFSCRIHCAGMACNLNRFESFSAPPKEVAIGLAESPPALTPLTTERRQRRQEGRCAMARFKPRQLWHLSATLDDRTVGETTLFEGAGVIGLYNVEVVKEFRRRGIGSALVAAALNHAKKLGHDTAVLAATGMGARIYARQGFEEVCTMSFWKYGKMRQLLPFPH